MILTDDICKGWANPNSLKPPRFHYFRDWYTVTNPGSMSICGMIALERDNLVYFKEPFKDVWICPQCKERLEIKTCFP